ncbi:hypothetical protein HZC33_00080 [Candidatus Wolfebacteria bacterium]|nr:hypothetical protein [Candidatus Wolfebacteria bacterium]
MMFINNSKIIVTLLLISIAAASGLCLWNIIMPNNMISPENNTHSSMLNEHILMWDNLSAAASQTIFEFLLLIILFALIFEAFKKSFNNTLKAVYLKNRLYEKNFKKQNIFDHLKCAFSCGILHPKIYA